MTCHRSDNFKFFFFLLISFLSAQELIAQSSLSYRWYLNANGGITQLYGDVQNENNFFSKFNSDETSYGFGARLGKYIGPVFTAHLQFQNSKLIGQRDNSDVKFTADIMEYQLGTTINFSNLFFGKKERTFSVYGTTGMGVLLFRSEASKISTGELKNDYGYTDDATREKSTPESTLMFPLGLGLDIKLANRWYLNLESAIRFTNSDKLDATVSGPNNDSYYYTSLGISYNFSGKKPKEIFETSPEILIDPYVNETVDLVYDIPVSVKSTEEFVIKSIIYKGKIDGPGRLVQILPIGLNILDSIIAGAKTEFINYTLYLNWDELPADSVFEISYRVKPDKIYGLLPMVSNLYVQRVGKEYKFRTNIMIEKIEEVAIQDEPIVKKDTIITEKEIVYRVQITAGYKSKIPIETLTARYNLSVEIKEDCLGNWCHYSVGSFDTYEQAKEYRNKLMSENGVRDAFIVAFYKGKRLNELSEIKEIAATKEPIKTVYKEGGYCYRVQILAMLNKSVNPETLREMHNIEEEVNEEVYHNWRKYTVGKCTSIGEAKLLLNKLKGKGLTDSFIATYKDGERVLTK